MNPVGEVGFDADVIVVGGGPGGGSAAFHLARRRRRVLLLDRGRFPRDKSCGDGLTPQAVEMLTEMDVLSKLPNICRVSGVRLCAKSRGSRDFRYPARDGTPGSALVIPRRVLDIALCTRAVEEGATFWQGANVLGLLREDGQIMGVEVEHDGVKKQVRARAVVAADGACSALARQAGLFDTSTELGFAIRGYYSGIRDLSDLYEIYMPLLDSTDRFLLPSYGWVFPTGPETANIGVGVFQRIRQVNVRRLMERFVASLATEDARFRSASPCGAWSGAPLRFDFHPGKTVRGNLLLVGDAAGLINPFTGEGISYALASGKLAAVTIDECLEQHRKGALDLSAYARELAQNYFGLFEAGRHSARRYVLVWHVLESTFQNERPLFSLCRRAILTPEGMDPPLAASSFENPAPLWHAPVHRLKADLQAVTALVTEAVRSEWPVVARLAMGREQELGILLRPALLLLLCFYAGSGREDRAVLAGAAVEFGCLAALAHASVCDDGPTESNAASGSRVDWGNLFALAIGDFLLSRAYEAGAKAGTSFSTALSEALARVAAARVEEREHAFDLEFPEDRQFGIIAAKNAMLFEVPCRLGAECGGLRAHQVDALGRYGSELGSVHHLVDEVLYVREGEGAPTNANETDFADGLYSLTMRSAARGSSTAAVMLRELATRRKTEPVSAREVRRLVRDTDAPERTISLAGEAKQRAQQALRALDRGPIRRALWGLANSALGRLKR